MTVSLLDLEISEIRYYLAGRNAGHWSACTTFWSPAFRSCNKSLFNNDDYQVQATAMDFLGPLDFKRPHPIALQEAA